MIEIRQAEEDHLSALPAIERAASGLFSEQDLPAHLRRETVSERQHRDAWRQALLLVALEDGVRPVAFAVASRHDSCLHLVEMDVHPMYQRRGIGSALLERVVALARENGCTAVTLTTFKLVAWNAPWYETQGFRKLRDEELPPWLRAILDQEREKGLDPLRRVAMRKGL